MKLVVPYYGEVRPADTRLIRLAEFLGITCHQLSLLTPAERSMGLDDSEFADGRSCLVINPEVIREWVSGEPPSADFVALLLSRFRRVLVHAVRPDSFHSSLIAALTAGRFYSVQEHESAGTAFNIAPDSHDVCEAFAGLLIGTANPANDRTFAGGECSRKLITLGADAFFAETELKGTEIYLIGSEDIVDLDTDVGDNWICECFSRFIPYAMALRHIFGEQCWHPALSHACVIVDDPLLRANYGFLNFEQLLRMMEQHHFKTTIAFIPHNFRRSSPSTVRFFRNHEHRLSLCFHGNDHTGAEFAATDLALLNSMLQTAEHRMAAHSTMTGLRCDRVMVFPQGKFSVESMAALRAHNFDAAVNTESHAYQQPVPLTLRELAQPAVLRHAGFPLFLRKSSIRMQDGEIAFRLLFGIPILIVEHHNVFESPESLIDAVVRINRAAPNIRWSSVGEAVRGSVLRRRDASGILHLKAYAGTVQVNNPSQVTEAILVEWSYRAQEPQIDSVHRNGIPCGAQESDDVGIRVSAVLEPSTSEVFSVRYREADKADTPLGYRYSARAFIRRRLSEIRDNYISRSPSLLAAAETLQRCVKRH